MTFDPILLDKKTVLPRLDVAKMVFALALKRILPLATILGSERDGFCFKSTFFWDGPLPPPFLTLMQEEMRGIKKESLPLKRMEMLRSNAAAFLRHHGFSEKAAALEELIEEETDEVVPFVRLGDALEEPFGDETLETSFDLGYVQLLNVTELGNDYFEVLGTAFDEDKEAKQFAKVYRDVQKQKERVKPLFHDLLKGSWITTLDGVAKKDQLLGYAREAWKTFGYQEVVPLSPFEDEELDAIFELTSFVSAPYYVLKGVDRGFLFGSDKSSDREMVRITRFLTGWLKERATLAFELEETKIPGGGKRMEWKFIDSIGSRLPGPFIEMKPMVRFSSPKKELLCHPITFSLVGHLESWLMV